MITFFARKIYNIRIYSEMRSNVKGYKSLADIIIVVGNGIVKFVNGQNRIFKKALAVITKVRLYTTAATTENVWVQW